MRLAALVVLFRLERDVMPTRNGDGGSGGGGGGAKRKKSSPSATANKKSKDRGGKRDLYGVLRVDRAATATVIRKAYFKLALTCVCLACVRLHQFGYDLCAVD